MCYHHYRFSRAARKQVRYHYLNVLFSNGEKAIITLAYLRTPEFGSEHFAAAILSPEDNFVKLEGRRWAHDRLVDLEHDNSIFRWSGPAGTDPRDVVKQILAKLQLKTGNKSRNRWYEGAVPVEVSFRITAKNAKRAQQRQQQQEM